ncbi:hypothetical protein PP353_gp44 [Arthrobacter phage Kumotta]|uniref:Uncharacterized protein n=1 Tax=Arthrobacter phage Kumotta TaxID=2588498 RepID=A0A4Y6EVW6_9CAUD|nr:hypothetical protein PP353_gp44 [Arthrobacter phage Kumotta]QDF19554.1 hypothetical protein SEA_KUMOTTA_44 [Arthrobacter phage Kumotta]
MSTERDELAEDIRGLGITVIDGPPVDLSEPLAQHLHNLGYRKPRTITSRRELDTIRVGGAIQTSDTTDTVVLKSADGNWRNQDGADLNSATLWRYGTHPFTLIFEGSAS